jgi:hypothetical protein
MSYVSGTGHLIGVQVGLVTLAITVLCLSLLLGVAATTLIAAALFILLSNKAQRLLGGRFNQVPYDARVVAASFACQLPEDVYPEAAGVEFVRSVRRSVEPSQLSRLQCRSGCGRTRPATEPLGFP